MPPYRKRQLPVPNEGFAVTAKIVNTDDAATTTDLVVDPNATTVPVPTAIVTTTTPLTTQTTPTSTPAGSTDATAGASAPVSMNTIVGGSVGAFIGAAGLILLALFFYRRYFQSLEKKAVRHGAPLPRPQFLHHTPSKSSSSSASDNRSLRQLVAAASLDELSEDDVATTVRVASMQPPITSHSWDSMYTDANPDVQEGHAMAHSFPDPARLVKTPTAN